MEIIQENEVLIFKYQDTKTKYRRIPGHKIQEFVDRNTNRKTNRVNSNNLMLDAFEYAIIDWDGITVNGKKAELTREVFDALPGGYKDEFIDILLDGRVESYETESKNSARTSGDA